MARCFVLSWASLAACGSWQETQVIRPSCSGCREGSRKAAFSAAWQLAHWASGRPAACVLWQSLHDTPAFAWAEACHWPWPIERWHCRQAAEPAPAWKRTMSFASPLSRCFAGSPWQPAQPTARPCTSDGVSER